MAAGCGRQVRPGRALCREHERGAYGREVEGAVGRPARRVSAELAAPASRPFGKSDDEPDRGRQRRAAKEFGRRLAQAATEQGLAEEIGALRVMLAKLLTAEGEDPLRLAHGVARAAGVTVRAVWAQRAIEGEAGDGLAAAQMRALAELDEERAAGDGRQSPRTRASLRVVPCRTTTVERIGPARASPRTGIHAGHRR